ncbi:DUF4030 domain-containing protein [Cytobacillus sp. FJAT-54145]|uniref:DUF4030 domain-containing protein n=1 Tax=Cytobacillus spartinae TaxID=3299023 RepID=A0ABW6K9E3_9BACI
MKIDEQLKKDIEEDMKKIKAPTSLFTFAENIKEESLKMNHQPTEKVTPIVKKNKTKKYPYVAAAVIGFGVLTASAFLNPSMAEMASKIPYLGQVFIQEPVYDVIVEALQNEGYEEFSFGETPGDAVTYSVLLKGTKEDADREREKVTGILEDILKSRGYDNYKIEVSSYMPEYTQISEEDRKLGEFGDLLTNELKAKGYDIIGVNPYNSEIEVSIPLTETRVDEIKNATLDLAKANGSDKGVKMDIIDVEANEREGQWMEYVRAIYDGLAGKKEYKVSGYGYSYKNQTFTLFIKTSIKKNDSDAKESVEKIRKEVDAFLSSDEVKNSKIGNDRFELVIRDKGGNDFK